MTAGPAAPLTAASTTGADGGLSLALAAGGTAGHVMIAVAIAEALARAAPGADVLFVGTGHGVERVLVPARGFRLELVPGAPFQRQRLGGKLTALGQAVRAVMPARRLLVEHRARLVLGTGGYASLGVLAAARSLGMRTAIHEANVVPGLANRLLGRVVERVYLSHRSAAARFPRQRCRVTGTPLRAEIEVAARRPKSPPAADRKARVLVTAGSEGSRFLGREAPRLLQEIARLGVAVEARHQADEADLASVREVYARCGIDVRVVPFPDDMAAAYEWADLAIASCGASTVAELATVGLPALLVPVRGTAEEHQASNARLYAEGGAWTVSEEAWSAPALAARSAEILTDSATWRAAARGLGPTASGAAAALVDDILAWIPDLGS